MHLIALRFDWDNLTSHPRRDFPETINYLIGLGKRERAAPSPNQQCRFQSSQSHVLWFHCLEEERGDVSCGLGWFVAPTKVDLLEEEAMHHTE